LGLSIVSAKTVDNLRKICLVRAFFMTFLPTKFHKYGFSRVKRNGSYEKKNVIVKNSFVKFTLK